MKKNLLFLLVGTLLCLVSCATIPQEEIVEKPIEEYKITYNLNGGELPEGEYNPLVYNSDSSDFTLVNPVRSGYNFVGWTEDEIGLNPIKTVTVKSGSIGDRTYFAKWNIISYNLTYKQIICCTAYDEEDNPFEVKSTIEDFNDSNNPLIYDREKTILLNNPTKEGYSFLGWIEEGNDCNNAKIDYIIPYKSSGDKCFVAIWAPKQIPVGIATLYQLQTIVYGKNNIKRPDWVIKVPVSDKYFFEKDYAKESDLQSSIIAASNKCLYKFAEWIGTKVSIERVGIEVRKDLNNVSFPSDNLQKINVEEPVIPVIYSLIKNREMVEYWEDADGGVWVLMRIPKENNVNNFIDSSVMIEDNEITLQSVLDLFSKTE